MGSNSALTKVDEKVDDHESINVYAPTNVNNVTTVNETGVDPKTLDAALGTIQRQSDDITKLAQGDQQVAESLGNTLGNVLGLLGGALVGGFSSMTQSMSGMFRHGSQSPGQYMTQSLPELG